MNRFANALAATALLALGACGGGGEQAAADNNLAAAAGTDNVTLPPDENSALGAGETLSNQLNALETENALGNQVTDNGTSNTATSADDSTANAAANTAVNGQ